MQSTGPVFQAKKPFTHELHAQLAAEFVGTFFLVFTVGCNVHTGSIGAAVSIGAILMVMVYALGPVSGAHLNPAVTFAIGLSMRYKITLVDMCAYIIAQLSGGLTGAICYWIIFNDAFLMQPNAAYSARDAAWVEILYTAALAYVVLNVATTENPEQGNCSTTDNVPNSFYGLAIGLTVTAAAIAVGPISGCSLNPAVSFGALFASRLANGAMPMSMVGLYILAPLFGAAIGTLFFFFVQGGLTGQYEYPMGSPAPSPVYTPVVAPPPHEEPHHFRFLDKGELFMIPKVAETHTIFVGVSWKIKEQFNSGVDIDVSCAKYGFDEKTGEGKFKGQVYFTEHEGHEAKLPGQDRSQAKSIIVHQGDNITGKGRGFGFLEDPDRHRKKKGQPAPIRDDERIEIRQLAELRKYQKTCTFCFFLVNVYSAKHKFEHMEELTIRLVDTEGEEDYEHSCGHELLRFTKKGMTGSGFQGSGYILGCLIFREDLGRWFFQVIDDPMDIKEHGTYRDFEPRIMEHIHTMFHEDQEIIRKKSFSAGKPLDVSRSPMATPH
jgi:aquaporin Z